MKIAHSENPRFCCNSISQASLYQTLEKFTYHILCHVDHVKRSISIVDFRKKVFHDQFYLRMILCICNELICTRIQFPKFTNVRQVILRPFDTSLGLIHSLLRIETNWQFRIVCNLLSCSMFEFSTQICTVLNLQSQILYEAYLPQ